VVYRSPRWANPSGESGSRQSSTKQRKAWMRLRRRQLS